MLTDQSTGIVIGVVITTLGQLVTAMVNARNLRRETFTKGAFDAALAAFKGHQELAGRYMDMGIKSTVMPPEQYALGSMMIFDLARKGKLSQGKAKAEMEKVHAVLREVEEFYRQRPRYEAAAGS